MADEASGCHLVGATTMASLPQKGMRQQPLTVEVESHSQTNDSSGSTPEPSPVGPPKATEYDETTDDDKLELPPMSARNASSREPSSQRHTEALDVVEEPFPISLPRAPSPYSPPPGSLFSGEEPIRVPPSGRHSNRPPLHEVSIEALPSTAARLKSHHFSFEAHVQDQARQMASLGSSSYHSSPQQHRSFLVPAVMQLKRELLESHQTNFLLQKEYEALSAQHRSEESELRAAVEQLREERDRLLESEERGVLDLQKATEKASALEETVRQLEQDKQQLRVEVQSLTSAEAESKNQVQQQAEVIAKLEVSNQDMQRANDSLDAQIRNLQSDNGELRQRLSWLNEQLERESAAASGIPYLQHDKESLQNELVASKAALETSKVALQESQQQVQSLQGELKEARLKVKQIAMESSQRARELQEQLDGAQSTLQQERSSRQLEVDRLRAMLKEVEIESSRRATEVSKETAELQAEVTRLEKSLKSSTLQSAALRGDKLALRKELAQKAQQLQRYENVTSAEAACQTDATELREADTQTETIGEVPSSSWSVTGGSDHDSLTDRLGRIRDASDRAAMLQEYRREINRIKGDYQAEVRKLEDSYNYSLQRVISEAKEEVNTQTREYKRQLKSEWEVKLASLERQHQLQLNQAQEEYESKMAVANVAVEAATSELTLTREELEREHTKRRQLEETASALKVQVEYYRRRERELALQKEDETRVLLASIRDECNLAFDRRGVRLPSILSGATAASSTATLASSSGSKSGSPRSVVFSEEPSPSAATMMQTPRTRVNSTGTPRATPSPSALSLPPARADLDRALDETEALVRSLVGV